MSITKNQNLFKRLGHALSGVACSLRSEKSFRTHVVGLAFVLVVLFLVQPSPVWWALLLLTSGCVLVTELINTAIEKLIDHLHPGQHPMLKTAKDTLAGAVLVISVMALLVFAAFLWSRISP